MGSEVASFDYKRKQRLLSKEYKIGLVMECVDYGYYDKRLFRGGDMVGNREY